MSPGKHIILAILRSAAIAAAMAGGSTARAETLPGALAKAYHLNPQLNAQRAALRAADENVPKALSGYRPAVSATGDLGLQNSEQITPGAFNNDQTTRIARTTPRGVGLSVQQNVFNGGRTRNGVMQADAQVAQGREQLRSVEQTVLANAASAYLDVLRDAALLNLRNVNVKVLQQQLALTRIRRDEGDLPPTDVAQAEAALAQGRADAFVAASTLKSSMSAYRQLIGDAPKSLAPASPFLHLIPKTQNAALASALSHHPDILAAQYAADVATLSVKIASGALLPTLNVTGTVQRRADFQNIPDNRLTTASIIGQLSVPLYDGGTSFANIRQSREVAGQSRFQVEVQRETVRAAVISSWGSYENSASIISAQREAVRAAEEALRGVREAAFIGQRTTMEVLNAQQVLLNARTRLIQAQRDRIVSSFAVLVAVGLMNAEALKLDVQAYRPQDHYEATRGRWWGSK